MAALGDDDARDAGHGGDDGVVMMPILLNDRQHRQNQTMMTMMMTLVMMVLHRDCFGTSATPDAGASGAA